MKISRVRPYYERFPRSEKIGRAHSTNEFFLAGGMNKIESPVRFHRFHKFVSSGYGDIEIVEPVSVLLAGNEIFDIRVIDSEHAHVRTHVWYHPDESLQSPHRIRS